MKDWRWVWRLVQRVWAECLARTGGLWWAKRKLGEEGAIVVLAFHRVLDDEGCQKTASLPGMIVHTGTFAAMAEFLTQRYRVVDVMTAEPGRRSNRVQIALTFDDGWADNARLLFPLVRRSGLPVSIFVCTGVCGQEAPFPPERIVARMRAGAEPAAEREIEAAIEEVKRGVPVPEDGFPAPEGPYREVDRTMTWDQITRMRQAGIRFGSHTRTHAALPALARARADEELAGARADLERALGGPCEALAYPYGKTNPDVREWVHEAGYRLAFTIERGAWTRDCDRLNIPRNCVWEGSFTGLCGRFAPVMFEYAVVWRAWRAMMVHRQGRQRLKSLRQAGVWR